MIEFGHATHAGLHHHHNQDTYCADPALGLFLIADGMGDPVAGARAAALARDVMCAQVHEGQSLESAVRAANRTITAQRGTSRGLHAPVGVSMVALQVHGASFEAIWVGDCQLYLHAGTLYPLARNAAPAQDLLANGLVQTREAYGNQQRNGLAQALGVTSPDDLRIEHVAGELTPGMRVLLCSDGLSEHLDDDVLGRWLSRHDLAAQEIVDALVLAALDAGHSGNMTAMLLRCRAAQDR